MWLHERENWTDFEWDGNVVASPLEDVMWRLGRSEGKLASLSEDLERRFFRESLVKELVSSCAIEGETVDERALRLYLSVKLGTDIDTSYVPKSRRCEGLADVMLDVCDGSRFLTEERLQVWHEVLLEDRPLVKCGQWRSSEDGEMQVVSRVGNESRVCFKAPDGDAVPRLMKALIKWINHERTMPVLVKAAIVHCWFLTVHPFLDGNGRMARLLSLYVLYSGNKDTLLPLAVSAQILSERAHYYALLEAVQRRKASMTDWVSWYVGCVSRALDKTVLRLAPYLERQAFFDELSRKGCSDRQTAIVLLMLDKTRYGKMTAKLYAGLSFCSAGTALNDLNDLTGKGVVKRSGSGGRSTYYELARQYRLTCP